MKTIFLASGKSSRMNPISDKNLLNFCGEPLFLKLLKNARRGGLENFVIVANRENFKKISKICEEKFPAKVVIQKNLDDGMGGGVRDGLDFVDPEESVFVLGGNDFVEPEIFKKIKKDAKNHDGGVLAKKIDEYFPGGYLEVDKNQRILSIVEKPAPEKTPSEMVNVVVHFFKKSGDLRSALDSTFSNCGDWYEVALDKIFKKLDFVAVQYDGVWQAVKYPWHILEMMEVFLRRGFEFSSNFTEIKNGVLVHKTAEVSSSAVLKNKNILIDARAKILENSVISGPCYIGEDVVVGNGSLVRDSIVGSGSRIGYNTEIARSFLAENVSTHISYIGDSVVGDGVNFGAFSCTANLRLDKKTVRVWIKNQKIDSHRKKLGAIVGAGAQIGIHASCMPGVKIPSKTFVHPGSTQK